MNQLIVFSFALGLSLSGELFARDFGVQIQNEIHYKVNKALVGTDKVIVEDAETCDPQEATRMPFFN